MKGEKKVRSAIVLLSGGLDSATTLYFARDRGFRVRALLFDYGQRHRVELNRARRLAKRARVPVTTTRLRLPWKGSALLDRKARLPRSRHPIPGEIPATYVPARNLIFLSFAASYAEAAGAGMIFIGANAIDYSGYPDCRPEFYEAFALALRRGLKTGVEGRPIRVLTPLIRKTKAQIIRLGARLGVPYELTWSCYHGGRRPCGRCDSCLLRAKGFAEAGLDDPALG